MTKNIKISFFLSLLLVLASFGSVVYAATPSLSLVPNSNGDTVQVNVNGDANSGVLLFYTKSNVGGQVGAIGTTNTSGSLSVSISSSGYGIAGGSTVYVTTGGINGAKSVTSTWPNVSTTGSFSLSQTGITLTVGQSTTITAMNNPSGTLYLSNNSNPPIANVNISNNQIAITALAYGSTTISICSTGNSTTCASAYVTVQNGNASALNFSISNVTVSPGQSVPITISGGTGTYTILNNSNSGLVQGNINGSTITVSTNNTSGTAAITVCSSDMSSCGIINVTAGSSSTSPLAFSQTNPTLSVGQTTTIGLSGGNASTYYVGTNTNTTSVQSTISGSNLMLTGNSNGTANLTVCSTSGSCGTLTVTVSYTASGGQLQLSQTTVSLLVGQVLSITASGGTAPYSLSSNPGNIFQSSLNGNVITLSGIASGSSSVNVCSQGGACLALTVVVNSSGAGTPITFSQNNLSLNVGGSVVVTVTGSGGYYVSNSSNSSVATAQVSGSIITVTGATGGTDNISICQSGGGCALLFVTVGNGSVSSTNPVFSQTSPNVSVGQSTTVTISGGSGSGYYVSANSNPSSVQTALSGNALTVTGLINGSSTVVICSSSSSCSSLTVSVGATSTSSLVYFSSTSLPAGTIGQAYSDQLSASGGNGSYTYSIASGTLPSGLTLSSTGLLSGTPQPIALGTTSFGLQALDSSGQSATATFTITVNSSLSIPTTSPTPTPSGASATPSGSYVSGQLINESGTVYIVYLKTKVAFANAPAFLGLGFKFSNVISVTDSGLTLSPRVVITADGAHPRGTWLLDGKAVYFLTPTGLIPVASWDVFLSNGGQASFLVKANSRDLAFSKLPVMTANDSRVN